MLRLAAVAVVLALPVATAGARPVAHIAKSCSLSAKEKGGTKPSTLGATYVTSLTATHVSCGKAKALVKAFQTCRHKHGKSGRCPQVNGYSCSEKRLSSPTEYDSKATCTKGKKVVKHGYVQFT